MSWEKKGVFFRTTGAYFWNQTHAQGPFLDCINEKIWRVYYNTRDDKNHTRTSYIDVEAGHPEHIIYKHPKPILDLGPVGAFDDCGSMGTQIINFQGKKYMFYIGWNVRNTVPYHLSLGVAVSDDGIVFKKCFSGPILDRIAIEPYMCTSCDVRIEDGLWKMWYTSGNGYVMVEDSWEPLYDIKYATSADGVSWERHKCIAVPIQNKYEALGVPSVLFEDEKYKMWYSYRDIRNYRVDRNASYRIGYAESKDGMHFQRLDHLAGITISRDRNAWDGQMIAYGRVISYHGKKYMFYNGNGFGQSGMGYAVWKD